MVAPVAVSTHSALVAREKNSAPAAPRPPAAPLAADDSSELHLNWAVGRAAGTDRRHEGALPSLVHDFWAPLGRMRPLWMDRIKNHLLEMH